MITIVCDFCGAKTSKEFNHKVEIKPWYNPRVTGHVYHREFDCCEECAKAIEHRLIGIENNWLWHGKDPNRRYKNWDLSVKKVEAIPKADYETRLKADLKAILTELQLEIEEKIDNRDFMAKKIQEILQSKEVKPDDDLQSGYNLCLVDICNFIQQKIDKLVLEPLEQEPKESEAEDGNN